MLIGIVIGLAAAVATALFVTQANVPFIGRKQGSTSARLPTRRRGQASASDRGRRHDTGIPTRPRPRGHAEAGRPGPRPDRPVTVEAPADRRRRHRRPRSRRPSRLGPAAGGTGHRPADRGRSDAADPAAAAESGRSARLGPARCAGTRAADPGAQAAAGAPQVAAAEGRPSTCCRPAPIGHRTMPNR